MELAPEIVTCKTCGTHMKAVDACKDGNCPACNHWAWRMVGGLPVTNDQIDDRQEAA